MRFKRRAPFKNTRRGSSYNSTARCIDKSNGFRDRHSSEGRAGERGSRHLRNSDLSLDIFFFLQSVLFMTYHARLTNDRLRHFRSSCAFTGLPRCATVRDSASPFEKSRSAGQDRILAGAERAGVQGLPHKKVVPRKFVPLL